MKRRPEPKQDVPERRSRRVSSEPEELAFTREEILRARSAA